MSICLNSSTKFNLSLINMRDSRSSVRPRINLVVPPDCRIDAIYEEFYDLLSRACILEQYYELIKIYAQKTQTYARRELNLIACTICSMLILYDVIRLFTENRVKIFENEVT